MMIAAKVEPQSTFPNAPTKSFKPIATVLALVSLMKVLAKIKSFHISILYIDAIVITVFRAKGNTIVTNILPGLQPSTMAASINSYGTKL